LFKPHRIPAVLKEVSREIATMSNEAILIAFVALTGFALLVQAIVLVAIFLTAKKAFEKMRRDFDDLRQTAVPLFTATRDVLTKIAPKIEPITSDVAVAAASLRTVSADLAGITSKVRVQVEGVETSTSDVLERIRRQTVRVDTMVTQALDAADRAGAFLETTVSVPARQLTGILAAAKAILESLRARRTAPRRTQPANDHETFV
jgi:hypothetical protein